MAREQKITTSIIEPSDAELALYNQIIKDLTEEQLDEFANDYFDLVQQEKTKSSFPKFVIDKMIRPVKPGDTISFVDENNTVQYLFCLVRKDIEIKTYLLFALVDSDSETIRTDQVYLFHVDGIDEDGIEIIDIMSNSEESERILNILESDEDVELVTPTYPEESQTNKEE